ncbi:concanavalin A-like lectin/glucanase domain-containing protein [Chytridium lagenaria]|nr:concanavalin A-like lectin/glucanase domain-containing protein [Chytridium lagenaria]
MMKEQGQGGGGGGGGVRTESDNSTLRRPTMRRRLEVQDAKAAEEERKRSAKKWLKRLPWIGIIPSLGVCGVIIWLAVKSVPNYKYCLVLQDDFNSDSINTDVWSHEVGLGGFGNGEFQAYTPDSRTSFIKNGLLHIKPILTTEFGIGLSDILDGYTLNLTERYGCTGGDFNCARQSNSSRTNYESIINPVMSAKLRLKKPYATRYGKGEIRFKLPTGLQILETGSGLRCGLCLKIQCTESGPRSGELDILESRGNPPTYKAGGRDKMISTQIKSEKETNIFILSTQRRHGTLASGFHTVGWEWTPDYFLTWLDSPLRTNLYVPFNENHRTKMNGFPNRYGQRHCRHHAGLERQFRTIRQKFYLILNVAVGGTNGYFPDNDGNKPWQNSDSPGRAMYKFLEDLPSWYNTTWPENDDRAMQVDYVKIWKICNID